VKDRSLFSSVEQAAIFAASGEQLYVL